MKIAFLGDIAIFENGMLRGGWEKRLEKLEEILRDYDIVIANLETPLTSQIRTHVCKGMHLRSDIRTIDILKYLHIKAVSLANNHILDFGIKGLDDTKQALDIAGIKYFGVDGNNWLLQEKNTKIIFRGFCCYSANGAKYTKHSYEHGVNALTRESLVNALASDKNNGIISVLSLHWGDEYSHLPNKQQVKLIHALSNEYSFIVHGHHAHVMQGIEYCKGSLIAYNQGNCIFDECHSPVNPNLLIKQNELNRESFILSVVIDNGKLQTWRTIGMKYNDNGIIVDDNEKKIYALSAKIPQNATQLYKNEAMQMIRNQKRQNLQPHNSKWLISKLNYHSICAKLKSYQNRRRYKHAMSD